MQISRAFNLNGQQHFLKIVMTGGIHSVALPMILTTFCTYLRTEVTSCCSFESEDFNCLAVQSLGIGLEWMEVNSASRCQLLQYMRVCLFS